MPEKAHTLVARTEFDTATVMLSNKIVSHIVAYADGKGYGVLDLKGSNATRAGFENSIVSHDPATVVIASHGNENVIVDGTGNNFILDSLNDRIMSGRIGYFIACSTGKNLAPECVEKGAVTVYAFDDELIIMFYGIGNDPVPGFRETLTEFNRIFDGYTTGEVYDMIIESFEQWIDYWDNIEPMIADVLLHDMEHFKMYGRGDVKVSLQTTVEGTTLYGLTETLYSIILLGVMVNYIIRFASRLKRIL